MDWILLIVLLLASGVLMVLEHRFRAVPLSLTFKGDIKRESHWLAQYGQMLCTIVAALLMWRLDRDTDFMHRWGPITLLLAIVIASTAAMLIKRMAGRVRPGRENAGRFLGWGWKHANYRESFPSSHSAAAVAFAVVLSLLYWPAAAIFWTLAILCAALRFVMDAHWPSDVLAGIALGYASGHIAWFILQRMAG